jgi:hypothetical protein
MPTSPSPRRAANRSRPAPVGAASARPPSFRAYYIAFGTVAVLAVILFSLPASLIAHFLPTIVHAEDFSGTLWHGSCGKISVNGRDAGALEWRLHPAGLLHLTADADLHWVKGGFALDGAVAADRSSMTLADLRGGGPIEDLQSLGLGSGWRGTVALDGRQLRASRSESQFRLDSAIGDVTVSDLTIAQVAQGAPLGGYRLHFADAALAPDGEANGELSDTGGPLSLHATLQFSLKERRGVLSGWVAERADVPPALHAQLQNLAQLHARDAAGRIPVDLEFTL